MNIPDQTSIMISPYLEKLNQIHQKKNMSFNDHLYPEVSSTIENEKFSYNLHNDDFIFGRLLSFDLFTALFKKFPENNLEQTLKELHSELLHTYSLGLNDSEGYHLVNGEAIDYTFWNIIIDSDNTFNFIDKKWKSKDTLPADFILFRNLFNIYEKISPYLKNKNKKSFIIQMIQEIYPNYSEKRLIENLQSERLFQSFVSGKEQNFTLDSLVQYSVNEQVQQHKVLTEKVATLDHTIISKDLQLLDLTNHVSNLNQIIANKDCAIENKDLQAPGFNKSRFQSQSGYRK